MLSNQILARHFPSYACPALRREVAVVLMLGVESSFALLGTIRGSSLRAALRARRDPGALSHLVLATVGGKVLISIVVVPGPVLRPILVEMLGTTAILVRPRRSTVASAVVHYPKEHELAPQFDSSRRTLVVVLY